jgi:putative membrane protein
MSWIWSILIYSVAVFATALLIPGVKLNGIKGAVTVAVGLLITRWVVDFLVYGVFGIISIPLSILTLGLFSVLVNVVIIKIVDAFSDDFDVQGITPAILFSIVLAIISGLLKWMFGK